MAKPKKRKKPLHIGRGDQRVSSSDLPPHAVPHDVQIIAPDTGERVLVTKTLRDAPLDRLHARKQIDDCLYAAGDWCRALFENFGTDGVRAMDFSRPAVDQSHSGALGVTDAQLRAGKRLKNIANFLGAEGFDLAVQVLARRKFIEQIARERGLTSQRDKDFLARRFRECLDTIATLGGFKVSGAVPRTVGDSHAQIARSANKPELHRALVAANDDNRLAQFRRFLTEGKQPVARPRLSLPPQEGEAA